MRIPFLLLVSLLMLSACMSEDTYQTATTEPAMDTPVLRHVVLIKFKPETTPEQMAEVEAAFVGLKDKIDAILDLEWGTNNSPEGKSAGFTHCFFITFADEAAREVYLPHPDHTAFGDVLVPHLEDVLVVDYWSDGSK